jgi:hypothetical protein
MRKFIAVAGFLVFSLSPVWGEGLFHGLPADGDSVRFDLQVKMNIQGMEKEATGSLSMSSVGKASVNGNDCRWIEIKMMMMIEGIEQNTVAKVLIPESKLKVGESLLDHAVKGYLKEQDNVKEINDFKGEQAGPLPFFLSGPLDNPKKLEKEVTETGIGKLDCEGLRGSKTIDQGDKKVTMEMENRLNNKAPFGVVYSKMQFKLEANNQNIGEGTLTLRLIEIGKNAKSELPNNQ